MSELESAVFLITGPPASGRSTVAGLLAKRFAKGVHVPGDVFRRMVVSGREAMGPNASADAWQQLRLRYHLGATVADAYVAAGFTGTVDRLLGADGERVGRRDHGSSTHRRGGPKPVASNRCLAGSTTSTPSSAAPSSTTAATC